MLWARYIATGCLPRTKSLARFPPWRALRPDRGPEQRAFLRGPCPDRRQCRLALAQPKSLPSAPLHRCDSPPSRPGARKEWYWEFLLRCDFRRAIYPRLSASPKGGREMWTRRDRKETSPVDRLKASSREGASRKSY